MMNVNKYIYVIILLSLISMVVIFVSKEINGKK